MDVLLVPIHHNDHWLLAALMVSSGRCTVFDSAMGKCAPKTKKMISMMVRKILALIWSESMMTVRWAPKRHQDEQEDGYSCGLYLIVNARRFLERSTTNLVSNNNDEGVKLLADRVVLRALVAEYTTGEDQRGIGTMSTSTRYWT
ncbi:unnamed protein product [Caenorhabditis bovis]|uniref:Ubiquitin-like protease family profile domain-containing protein n=1 Tax=Caenorhabditis bovis TaxID=2654633 RepID=A0A8S1F8W6_9PELO|nr:unnamed protein product [Caenorhabditis bovis]